VESVNADTGEMPEFQITFVVKISHTGLTCPTCGKLLQLVGGNNLIIQAIDIEI